MSLYTKKLNFHTNLNRCELEQPQQTTIDLSSQVNCRESVIKLVELQAYAIFMAIVTIYSIFAIDVSKTIFTVNVVFPFGIAHIVAISLFTIQIGLNVYAKELYNWSFYFWIDIVSTLSMVLQVYWVQTFLNENTNVPVILTFAKVIKASRLTRIGARVAKCITHFLNSDKNKSEEEEGENIENKITENQIEHRIVTFDKIIKNEKIIEEDQEENCEVSSSKQNRKNESKSNSQSSNNLQSNNLLQMRSNRKTKLNQEQQKKTFLSIVDLARSPVGQSSHMLPKWSNQSVFSTENHIEQRSMNCRVKQFQSTQTLSPKAHQLTDIIERWQRSIVLPTLCRPYVDPIKSQQIQQRWNEIIQKQQQARNKLKQKFQVNQQNFKLGLALKLKIQQNIIVLIMGLIIILPLISVSTWIDQDIFIEDTLKPYFDMILTASQPTQRYLLLKTFVKVSLQMTSPLVYMEFPLNSTCCKFPSNDFNETVKGSITVNDLLQSQKTIVENDGYLLIFNNRVLSQDISILNIGRSVFVTLLLIFSSIIFMNSIEKYVLEPLEQMCVSINKISSNPFEALRSGSDTTVPNVSELETDILERAIIKMTNVLALGAGQFGSKLISTDNQETNQAKRANGIFMYVKLANFQELTDKLDWKMVACYNRVAWTLHQLCVRFGGMPIQNTNMGFLLFWRIDDKLMLESNKTFSFMKPSQSNLQIQRLAQLALHTFVQAQLRLQGDSQLIQHKEHQSIEKYVLHAGLHVGSAIQGSLGSIFKLEPKCLGIDVVQAQKLCDLAAQYGTSNVLSDSFVSLLTDIQSDHIRKLDYVSSSYSNQCFWIYCMDFSCIRLSPHHLSRLRTLNKTHISKQQAYRIRQNILKRIQSQSFNKLIPKDKIQAESQRPFSRQFYQLWTEALQQYFNQDWDQAASLLDNVNVCECLFSNQCFLGATMALPKHYCKEQIITKKCLRRIGRNIIKLILYDRVCGEQYVALLEINMNMAQPQNIESWRGQLPILASGSVVAGLYSQMLLDF